MLGTACLLTLFGACTASPTFAAPRHKTKVPRAKFVLGLGRLIEPGIVWNEVRLPSDTGTMRVWIWRPIAAQKSAQRFPAVFVAPAGTPLFYGMKLGQGDTAEQLPYARAGFVVVAYELDGDVANNRDSTEIVEGAREFVVANGGINNGIRAINFALASVPNLDSRRLYVAGHSSAGTVSLQVAQWDRRVAACVAYAPCTDIAARLGLDYINTMEARLPEFSPFISRFSPINNAARLRCPTFLFHADDDSNVPLSDNAAFAAKVRRTNSHLTFVRVPSGNHYSSMIQQGIPQAIRWLQSRPEATKPKAR